MYVVLRCSLINTFMRRHQVLTWDAVTVTDYREHRWTRSQSQRMCSNDPDTNYQTTPGTERQLDVHAQHAPWTFHAKRQKPAHTKSHSVVSHKKPHCHSTVYIRRHRGNNASGQARRRLTKACHVHKVPRNHACSFSHKVQGGSPRANAARLVEEKVNLAKRSTTSSVHAGQVH